MRVVILNDFAHVNGGASKVALESALGLRARAEEVILVTAVGPVMPQLGAAGVSVRCTGQQEIAKAPNRIRASTQGIWNTTAERAMDRLLADLDPSDTVVHVHGWTKALSSSPVRAALRRRFPVVCTLHDYFVACPNGGFFNYQTNSVCTLRPLSVSCVCTHCDVRSYPQKLYRVARQVVQRRLGKIPDGLRHFIVLSDLSRQVLARHLPPEARVYRVENPVEVVRGEPVPVARSEPFVVVGRLSAEKGVDLFGRAAAELGVRGVVVGRGPCEDGLRRAFPGLSYRGWLSPEDVPRVLAEARALVLPSLWYEAAPLVVREAAALGVPAIVADGCAAREWVRNGETGLWFRSGDAADLREQMRLLAGNPRLAERLGRAAYDRFWERPPTLDRHVEELLDVYASIQGRAQ